MLQGPDEYELYINTFLYKQFTDYQSIPQWVKDALDYAKINVHTTSPL